MTDIRELLAENMKRYRSELGLSQAKLAEKASLSTHYIAMIEVKRKFPKPEIMNQIAEALEVDTPALFAITPAKIMSLKKFQRIILENLETNVVNSVEKSIKSSLKQAVKDTVLTQIRELEVTPCF